MSTTTTFDPTKHPRGNALTGHAGQFATKEQTSSEVRLGGSRYRRPQRHTGAGLSDAEMLTEARRQIQSYGKKWGLSSDERDEALGDLMLDLASKRHRGAEVSARLVNFGARAVASRFVNGRHIRHEDSSAMMQLKTDADAFRELTGRVPTSRELTVMAKHIRDNWHDPEHRPSENFHRKIFDTNALSLEAPLFENGRFTLGDTLTADVLAHESIDVDALTDEQVTRLMGEVRLRRPAANSVEDPDELIAQIPQPATQMARFRTGAAFDERVFAPWPKADQRQRELIADRLISTGDLAERIWQTAVRQAA